MPELNFNALAQQGPQGVFQGFMQGQQLRNQLAGQEQQRQLGELQLQNALREQRMAGEEEAAYRAAGGDMKAVQTELMQRGLGKQAMAVGAQMAKQRADQLKMHKDTVELTKTAAQQVMANPQNAAQILSSFGQRFGIDMSDDLAQIQQLGGNPDAIRQWAAGVAVQADKLLPKFEQFETPGGGRAIGTVMPATGQFTPSQVLAPQMRPGEAERINLERQRVGLESQRVGLAQEEARLRREGVEGIAPKELQKREATFPAATQAVKGFESKSESFIKDLETLRDHPGLSQITGIAAGRLPGLTAEGRAAQALYDKIVAKGGFQALQDMRDASKTGGALGNVSNQEGKQLVASFAAIDRRQDAPDVRAAIDQAIGDIQGSRTRMREAYDATYAYRAGKPAPGAQSPAANIASERAAAQAAIAAGAPAAAVRQRFKDKTGQEL